MGGANKEKHGASWNQSDRDVEYGGVLSSVWQVYGFNEKQSTTTKMSEETKKGGTSANEESEFNGEKGLPSKLAASRFPQ